MPLSAPHPLTVRAPLGIGTATLVVMLLVASCAGSPTDSASTSSNRGSTPATPASPRVTDPSPTAAVRWRALSASPLTNRTSFVNVWTGTELLVCCGTPRTTTADATTDPARPQAAAYNPRTDTWRTVAAPPVPVESWGAIVAADRTIYFLDGGTAPWAYAAYDTDDDTWRLLAAPPQNASRAPGSHLGPAAWTGKEIVAPLATAPAADHDLVMVAYDPATNGWRTLPTPPVRMEPTSITFHDGLVTLLGEVRGAADQGSALVSATLDIATTTWNPPQRTPIDRRDPVVVSGGTDRAVAWDVSGTVRVQENGVWRDLPPIPFPEDECGWKGVKLERKLVLWRCTQQGAVLDTETEQWSVLPNPPVELLDSNILATNDQLLLWASTTDQLQPYALELG